MIKQLLNSVIAKYCDLSVSRRSIICRSRRLRQIIDLLATDKSRYFAQPRPIIVNYFTDSILLPHNHNIRSSRLYYVVTMYVEVPQHFLILYYYYHHHHHHHYYYYYYYY